MSTSLQIVILLLVAYVAVFLTTQFGAIKSILGAQIDPLPSLLVYCGLRTGLTHVFVVAVAGGLWMDALSANPLGTSILPLFLVGSFVNRQQDLILRQETYAQFVLGCFAGGLAPLVALVVLFLSGQKPLVSWASLWQWVILTLGGGVCAPAFFWFFNRLGSAFAYKVRPEISFRSDREIKRGRV